MLSILIPIYNFDSRKLIKELHRQCVEANVDHEIIVADDASTECLDAINEISEYQYVNFFRYDENHGRSGIRNTLAMYANHQYLMFIDCDAEICSNNYITKYVSALKPRVCISGGRALYPYSLTNDYSIERMYNAKREIYYVRDKIFTSFNFVIDKQLFFAYMFDENINNYGYEDNLFAWNVSKSVEITFIDNPLVHLGVSNNTCYLEKLKESTLTLKMLADSNQYADAIVSIRLYRTYLEWKKRHARFMLKGGLWILYPYIIARVKSANPSLVVLNLYKLYLLANT